MLRIALVTLILGTMLASGIGTKSVHADSAIEKRTTNIEHPRLVRSMQAVYLIDRGKRRWVTSPQVFTDYRFQEEWIEQIPDDDLNRIGLGPDLMAGPVLRTPDGDTWIVYQGTRRLVVGSDAYGPLLLREDDVQLVSDDFIKQYAQARSFGNVTQYYTLFFYLFTILFGIFIIFRKQRIITGSIFFQFYYNKDLLLFSTFSLFIKIIFVSFYPWLADGADSAAYYGAANHLIAGNSIFSEDKYNSFIGVTSPAYPIILYVLRFATLPFNGNVIGFKILQCFFSACLSIFCFFIVRKISGFLQAKIVLFISCLSPIWFWSAELIQYELVLSLFLTLSFLLFILWIDNPSQTYLVFIGGFLTGVSIFIQFKVLLVILLLFIIYISLQIYKKQSILTANFLPELTINYKIIFNYLFFISLVFLPTLVWGVRNYITHDVLIFSSVGSGVVLWMGSWEKASGGIMAATVPAEYAQVSLKYSTENILLRNNYIYRDIAVGNIINHFDQFIYLALVKIERFWWTLTPDRLSSSTEARTDVFLGRLFTHYFLEFLYKILNFISFIFSVSGVYSLCKRYKGNLETIILLFAFILIFCWIHVLFISEPRYRIPIIPFIQCLTAIGVAELVCFLFPKRFHII